MKILVVEDDPGIVSFLTKGLRAEGYTVDHAGDAPGAIAYLAAEPGRADLVLLDLGLPGGDGLDVLTWLRGRDSATPVVVLTARAEVGEKVAGLDAGANDYVTKPFSFAELLARVRAAVRTAGQPTATELVVGDLVFDLISKVARRDGRRIDLAPREWALLELFMRNPTQVFSRAQILDQVWDFSFDPGSNVVDVNVSHLRKKLNGPGETALIQTVRGAGYRLVAPGD